MVKVLAVVIAVTKPNHASAEAVADSDLTSKRYAIHDLTWQIEDMYDQWS
jgi:hypothetical protein